MIMASSHLKYSVFVFRLTTLPNSAKGMVPRRRTAAMWKGTCPVAIFPTNPAEEEKRPIARVLPSVTLRGIFSIYKRMGIIINAPPFFALTPRLTSLCGKKWYNNIMKCTQYFSFMRQRADRAPIKEEWITETINTPAKTEIQSDGRIRKWGYIEEVAKYLRVIL